jgi:hypothetical protein
MSGTSTCWINRCLATKTTEHHLDQLQVMQGGHFAQAFQISGLAGQNVRGRNGLQRVRRKAQIHLVSGFVCEIDREPGKHRVHGGDLAESPAAMVAVAATRQLHEGLKVLVAKLSGRNHFL